MRHFPSASSHTGSSPRRGRPLRAGIALGTNLGDRIGNLGRARDLVATLSQVDTPRTDAMLCAPVFETAPVGCEPGAGAFLNTVIELGWHGSPRELLEALQGIERQLGRPAAHVRNVSRPIDLDLLYAGNSLWSDPDLTLPHPRMHERPFVLAPLAAIRPGLRLPGQTGTVAELLAAALRANPGGALAPVLTEW